MPKYILGHHARARSVMLRYTLLIGLLLLVTAVIQVSFFGRFRFFGTVPDLMLCVVLALAYFSGRYTGAITGIAAGFLIEALEAPGISLLPIIYLLLGYLTGHYARAVIPKSFLSYLPYLSVGLAVRMATTLLYACLNYNSVNVLQLLIKVLLPEVLMTAVFACLLCFPIGLFCRLLEKKR